MECKIIVLNTRKVAASRTSDKNVVTKRCFCPPSGLLYLVAAQKISRVGGLHVKAAMFLTLLAG